MTAFTFFTSLDWSCVTIFLSTSLLLQQLHQPLPTAFSTHPQVKMLLSPSSCQPNLQLLVASRSRLERGLCQPSAAITYGDRRHQPAASLHNYLYSILTASMCY